MVWCAVVYLSYALSYGLNAEQFSLLYQEFATIVSDHISLFQTKLLFILLIVFSSRTPRGGRKRKMPSFHPANSSNM